MLWTARSIVFLNQRFLDLLDEEAFPSDLCQRHILNLVPGRFYLQQSHVKMGMSLGQTVLHPVRLI